MEPEFGIQQGDPLMPPMFSLVKVFLIRPVVYARELLVVMELPRPDLPLSVAKTGIVQGVGVF